jgi:hypothetical protein
MSWQRQRTSSRALLKIRSYVVPTFLMDHPDFLTVSDDVLEEWLRASMA